MKRSQHRLIASAVLAIMLSAFASAPTALAQAPSVTNFQFTSGCRTGNVHQVQANISSQTCVVFVEVEHRATVNDLWEQVKGEFLYCSNPDAPPPYALTLPYWAWDMPQSGMLARLRVQHWGGSNNQETTIAFWEPSVFTPTISTTNPTSGCGTGSAQVYATGGQAPVTFKLDNGSWGSTSSFSNLSIGMHTVYAKDANGCTVPMPFEITGPTIPVVSLVRVKGCNGECWLDAIVTGGVPPYSYQWSNGKGYNSSARNLDCNTEYEVEIWDDAGCMVTASARVEAPQPGPVYAVARESIRNFDVTLTNKTTQPCVFTATLARPGTGTVPYGNAGTGPYTSAVWYNWNDPNEDNPTVITIGNSVDLTGPGEYWLRFTDVNGCVGERKVVVPDCLSPYQDPGKDAWVKPSVTVGSMIQVLVVNPQLEAVRIKIADSNNTSRFDHNFGPQTKSELNFAFDLGQLPRGNYTVKTFIGATVISRTLELN